MENELKAQAENGTNWELSTKLGLPGKLYSSDTLWFGEWAESLTGAQKVKAESFPPKSGLLGKDPQLGYSLTLRMYWKPEAEKQTNERVFHWTQEFQRKLHSLNTFHSDSENELKSQHGKRQNPNIFHRNRDSPRKTPQLRYSLTWRTDRSRKLSAHLISDFDTEIKWERSMSIFNV